MKDPMNDEHYDSSDEQIEDLKDLVNNLRSPQRELNITITPSPGSGYVRDMTDEDFSRMMGI